MSATTPLVLPGTLTVQNAAEHRTLLGAALEQGEGVALDLSDVAEMDTAGLQLLVFAAREAAAMGTGFTLIDPSEAVREVLAIARLDLTLATLPQPRDHEAPVTS